MTDRIRIKRGHGQYYTLLIVDNITCIEASLYDDDLINLIHDAGEILKENQDKEQLKKWEAKE